MLLNAPRAADVMTARGLDGLAALVPINVHYVSGFWSQIMQAGFDVCLAAVLPRRGDAPRVLVCPAFDVRATIDAAPSVDEIVTYTTPATAPGGEETGAPYGGWPTRPGAALSPRQQRWIAETARLTASPAATTIHGLAQALRKAGLATATVGVDDERLLQWLPQAGLDRAKLVPARDAFNEIRLVKTAEEIARLRTAASLNEAAVMHALTALTPGMPWAEIERIYMTHMARHGAEGVYIACGSGGLQHGKVTEGEPIMFDGLGRYRGYHGDFGRSAVVGEPGPDVRARVRALESGWRAAYAAIRPGVRYSQIVATVTEAVHKAGFPGKFRPPVVHSLGLQHTDDPALPWGAPQGPKADRMLEPDMVLNVDLPHIEIGWGAVHLEDTVRVTADGCEPLTSMQTALRVIPA
jgi:Xaa-Pro aminopeptidase